ncbi:hypothetical protein [Stutzerimonas nitrititolerans]|uniref:Uncharacterized protein n=1 Tax=Stutzerimonas nitrititolerans TaxID=2482751 RepID=A0AA42BET7_9GAMM|nr:hypothetical protein [Stutzerimonas nitrititolerans]MCO7546130.1 hypothetical protein [Stutzerimonas nitrititolerans]
MFDISDAEYSEIMRKANEAETAYRLEQAKKLEEALSVVAALVSPRKLQHIKEYIAESEITSDFEITETHGGHKEDCTGYAFRYAYIDQQVGYLGDDFSGEIWIPLPKGKFLKFHFAM